MQPKRILVTGGAGFIGSHLVERLLAEGHQVSVVDDLSTGSLDNLAGVQGHPRLRVAVSTVSAHVALPEWVAGSDYIFHLAAAVGVELVVQSPIRTIETNLPVIGHIQLADNPGRNEPGTGELNYPFLFRHLDRIGYTGWVGCEYKPATSTQAGLGWLDAAAGSRIAAA